MNLSDDELNTILGCVRNERNITIYNNPQSSKYLFKLTLLIEKLEREKPIGGLP